ncbi:MAG: ATPase [Microbacteriaceae bacterium]|jgi:simple sugar transport system permease protein|nr:ATPase [Microbacteriaceae bacterium]
MTTVSEPRERPNAFALLRRTAGQLQGLTLLPVIVLVFVIGTFTTNGSFLTVSNLISVGKLSTALAVVVVAECIILIAGKIDLSLQSIFGLAPTVGAWLATSHAVGGSGLNLDPYLAMAATIAVGALVGAVNAFLVAYVRLNAFILTLAMLILLQGVQLGITSGKTLYDLPAPMLWIGSATLLGVPVDIWTAILVFVIGGIVLRQTRYGRSLYAVGGRALAARAAGINDRLVLSVAFIIGGALAAFGGLILTANLTAVSSTQGNNLIFSVFAAAVIGGVSLNGGRGGLLGALTGVILIALITNILTLSGFEPFWIDAASGLIIVIALLIARFTTGEAEDEDA